MGKSSRRKEQERARAAGGQLFCEEPVWEPYDREALARAGVPPAAADALADRGLPCNAYEIFVRKPKRELDVDDLPECGPAAFLADYTDEDNSYWASLADGSVWMRWGRPDEPADDTMRINTTVHGLQGVLDAICGLKGSGISPDAEEDEAAYNDAVNTAIVRAVSSDPGVFSEEEGWWTNFFTELEWSLPYPVNGEVPLCQLVRQDQSGQWVLDHPGFEDED